MCLSMNVQALTVNPYSIPVASFYVCIDCHGPRSFGSGQRCFACYRVRVTENASLRIAVSAEANQKRLEAELRRAVEREDRAVRLALRHERSLAKREARSESQRLRVEARERRVLRAKRTRVTRVSRDLRFQPVKHRLGRPLYPSQSAQNTLSLDGPISDKGGMEFGALSDVAADPAPNILERMIAAEGIQQIIKRLSNESGVSFEQAEEIVNALVDSDLLDDESVYGLADKLRSGWQSERLTTNTRKLLAPDFSKPLKSNPEPAQYEHWRRKYGLAKSGRVITRKVEVEDFGGAWSVETALPEEIERIA